MVVNQIWITLFSILIFIIFSFNFFRRIQRAIRRVSRRIRRSVRRFGRVQRKVAKTDPKVFNSINKASIKHVKAELDKNEWIKKRKFKKRVKNKVKIEIEREIQESPMGDMRRIVDKTVDATIDLAMLKEIERRGESVRIYDSSVFGKIISRLVLPLVTAGGVGLLTYTNPRIIPPGNIVVPELVNPPTGGPPPPVDPIIVAQSTAINAATYGIGALILISIIAVIRNR